MKIVLTKAYNPGDADVGNTYPHVYIIRVDDAPLGQQVTFSYQYGTATNNSVTASSIYGSGVSGTVNVYTWTPGAANVIKLATVSGSAYLTLTNQTPANASDPDYQGLMRALYQYLINQGLVAGSISNP